MATFIKDINPTNNKLSWRNKLELEQDIGPPKNGVKMSHCTIKQMGSAQHLRKRLTE